MSGITTTDYHTGGEPFRIVTGGVPALEGRTVPERRRWAAANIDHVRQLLVNEPRGHADMYGGFVTPPDDDGADLGVVFFHNEGYSTACGHGTIARPIDEPALRAWFETASANAAAGTEVPFATVDVASGRAIGSTRFMTIAPEHRRLEIGWTWVGTAYQRSGANREAKLLQLTHAFETLDAERVEFKTHARNERSRGALLGIGATFEGVLRHHTIMPDGTNRDSAFYSVLAGEWAGVKARLEALLAR